MQVSGVRNKEKQAEFLEIIPGKGKLSSLLFCFWKPSVLAAVQQMDR